MNPSFAVELLSQLNHVDPPGCCSAFVGHPNPLRRRQAVEVGFTIEHRFAFWYWIRCKQNLMVDRRTGERCRDEDFRPPDLVTWDWHDDVGAECDYEESRLVRLDQRDEEEVALFCWAGLRSLNDGQIAPAVWLNALGNVYVVQKQRDRDECDEENRTLTDRYGRDHGISYFRSPAEFAASFRQTRSGTGVIWDLDMDFFTEEVEADDRRYTPALPRDEILRLLSPEREWMPLILGDLAAVTIALEPEYTGGLGTSLDLYRTWEAALFDGQVFGSDCRWRRDLFRDGPPA